MRITDGELRFGAGDLVNHLACRYLTELNTQMAVVNDNYSGRSCCLIRKCYRNFLGI